MSDNTAPKLPSPPYFLMNTNHEFTCLDPEDTMRRLREHFSIRPDSVIFWKPEKWYKFKLFVFGSEGDINATLNITLFHLEGTTNVIEVHGLFGSRVAGTVLRVVQTLLEGDDPSSIQFIDLMKPSPLPQTILDSLPPISDDENTKGWISTLSFYNSPYDKHFEQGMTTIIHQADERMPHFVLETLCEYITLKMKSSIVHLQILSLFLLHPYLWEKLTEDEKTVLNSFVNEALVSLPHPSDEPTTGATDILDSKMLKGLMLQKVATRFREAFSVTT